MKEGAWQSQGRWVEGWPTVGGWGRGRRAREGAPRTSSAAGVAARRGGEPWSRIRVMGVLSLVGAGCAGEVPSCRGVRCEEVDIHVLTWWSSGRNGPGQSLEEKAEERPDVREVEFVPCDGCSSKDGMMDALGSMMRGEDRALESVDTFLANGGRDILQWTPCGGTGSSERLLLLDDVYPQLHSQFLPEVLAGVACCPSRTGCSRPHIYGVPLGLHRVNHILFNRDRFAAAGVGVESVEDGETLVAFLDSLRVEGRVMAVPAGDGGESLQYLLESLMLLVSGPDEYQSYFRGERRNEPEASPLGVALGMLTGRELGEGSDPSDVRQRNDLSPFLNNCKLDDSCEPPSDANEALQQVIAGEAAFMIMPDWFLLDAEDVDRGGAVAGAAFPGTEDTFLFTTDVFAIPAPAEPLKIEAGLRWLDVLLELKAQEEFAEDKKATPALRPNLEQRLLPSLGAQLPSTLDPKIIRESLNRWAQQGFLGSAGLVGVMPQWFAEAEGQGTLRVAPCDTWPCGVQ